MASSSSSELWSHPGTELGEHLLAVAEKAKAAVEAAPMTLSYIPAELMLQLAYVIGACHDLGKGTRFFQEYLKETDPRKKADLRSRSETHHALLSAFIALPWLDKCVGSCAQIPDAVKPVLQAIAFEAIRRHHGHLMEMLDELSFVNSDYDLLQLQWRSVDRDAFDRLLAKIGHPIDHSQLSRYMESPKPQVWQLKGGVRSYLSSCTDEEHAKMALELFFAAELLFSALIDADKKLAVGLVGDPPRIEAPSDAVETYRQAMGWGSSRGNNTVFQIRNQMYAQVMAQLSAATHQRFLTLTAPTGSGKTLAVLSFALKLRQEIARRDGYWPRMIYCLPFLSIIDQNSKVFRDVLRVATGRTPTENLLLTHHHLSDTTYRTPENEYDPDVASLLVEGWESEVIVTTFVQLFFTLIGSRNRPLRRFHRLAGAIVILDEVQSFPHEYWLLFRHTAETMARAYGTTFVLMTATQPMIFGRGAAMELVPDHETFYSSLRRVTLHNSSSEDLSIDDLAEIAALDIQQHPDKSFLFVLNTIRAAQAFHEALCRNLNSEKGDVEFMSSRVIPKHRLERIERLRNLSRNGGRWLAVTTQLVEAGVDIDAHVVYRDFGPLDSILQVSGRCNRNATKAMGQVKLFHLIDDNGKPFWKYIYDQYLVEKTWRVLKDAKVLEEPDFLEAANHYYALVSEGLSDDSSREYLNAMKSLNFDRVSTFRLIDEMPEVDVFVEVDEEAALLWKRFQDIRSIADLRERRMAFSRIKAEFYQHIVSVPERLYSNLQIPVDQGVAHIPREQVKKYYDDLRGLCYAGGPDPIW